MGKRRSALVASTRVAASAALPLVLLGGGCASSPQAGRGASPWRLSNQGVAVPVRSPRQLALLRRSSVDPASLHLLARRQGLSVISARSSGRGQCFLTVVRRGYGITVCGVTGFPSARQPAIDLSTLSAKPGDRHPRIVSLAGVAADGVARVAVRFVSGRPYSIPVIGNTYIDRLLPSRQARVVVMLDRRGRELKRLSFPVPAVR